MFKYAVPLVLVLGAMPVYAQSSLTCQDRAKLVSTLEDKYNERLDSIGLQTPELLLEIWSSDDTGSFTVLITKPNGVSCVVASGKNWQSFKGVVRDHIPGVKG